MDAYFMRSQSVRARDCSELISRENAILNSGSVLARRSWNRALLVHANEIDDTNEIDRTNQLQRTLHREQHEERQRLGLPLQMPYRLLFFSHTQIGLHVQISQFVPASTFARASQTGLTTTLASASQLVAD